ncbi:DsbA family protein [Deinococcus malanensis]|uniref:DsbA family protein n=1 Tax=Deinococcus malanensis TaxID=1706855 RepID=UPI00362CF55E
MTLDVSGGRVVGVLVEAPSGAALAPGVAAAWGTPAAGVPQLVKQLSHPELLASARRSFTEFTDEYRQDVIAIKITGQGRQTQWHAYLALKLWPDSAFPATRNVSGHAAAPNIIRIYSDFQFPYCRDLWDKALPAWEKEAALYRVAHYHFPLDFHKNAFAAAEASKCAAAQGAFWKMADRIFGEFGSWSRLPVRDADTQFRNYARSTDLNAATFDDCLTQRSFRGVVDAQVKSGLALGSAARRLYF